MSADLQRLREKVALVTGAGSGIGHAIAELFVKNGGAVGAVALRQESLAKWTGIKNVFPVQADLKLRADVDRMVDSVERELGPLDIVCNVAGINDLCYPLVETTDEMWDDVVDLDLKAPFQICRKVIPGMIQRGGGVILNVGSYAAVRGNHGPSYSAAKHGLTGLSLSIAVGYADKGIRCNVLNPGGVDTPLHSKGAYHPDGLRRFQDIVGKFPVRWICKPEEVAPSALFLCCDDSKHINGAVLAVDGGMSAC